MLYLDSHGIAVEELSKHAHTVIWHASSAEGNEYAVGAGTAPVTDLTQYAGNDKPHNNVQPSRAAYVWCRGS